MTSDYMVRVIVESLARHQSRGLVDDAAGASDVVIHGRVDLRAVAEDVLAAAMAEADPARKSWARWFASSVDQRRRADRNRRKREALSERLESSSGTTEAALVRMRLRNFPDRPSG